MATVNGRFVPGGRHGGDQFGTPWTGWPTPWALRCDDCGRDMPYRCVIDPNDRRTSRDEPRQIGPDRHRCGDCEGFTEQLGLGLAAPTQPRRCDFIEECNSPAAEGSKFCRFHRDLTAGKLPKYEREGRG